MGRTRIPPTEIKKPTQTKRILKTIKEIPPKVKELTKEEIQKLAPFSAHVAKKNFAKQSFGTKK